MWTLFPIAIFAAGIRLCIRLRSKGRLFLDDGFLIFACLTLIGASAVLQSQLDAIYLAEEVAARYAFGHSPGIVDIDRLVYRYHLAQNLHGTLGWLTVFSVKFSFLTFFRQLVDKIPRLQLYWKSVVAINLIAFLYCLLYIAGECQRSGAAAREYKACIFVYIYADGRPTVRCIDHRNSVTSSALVGTGIGVDILTDLLGTCNPLGGVRDY